MRYKFILIVAGAFVVLGGGAYLSASPEEAIGPDLFQHHYIATDMPGDKRWGYGTPALADFDGDDDLDFAFSVRQENIYWFERRSNDNWARHVLGAIPVRSLGGAAMDVDGDDRQDMVVGSYWYRNPGDPRTTSFERYRYDDRIDTEIHDIVPADVDGDEQLEVVASGDEEGAFWYDVPDDPARSANWPRTTITLDVKDDRDDIHATFFPDGVGDLDGDADADIVMPGRWYENKQAGTEWTRHDLPFKKKGPWGLSARSALADINQDGHTDIVMTDADQKQSRAAWLENDGGDRPTFTMHRLPQPASGERGSFHSLAVADFDEDDDLDIFTVEQEDGSIFPEGAAPRWYIWEHLNGPGHDFAERVILDAQIGGHDALAGDVDGDGDVDIVSKIWKRWDENANQGREHADLLENLTVDS